MTDTLTASLDWCRYDDDFKEKNGHRLPAGTLHPNMSLETRSPMIYSPNLVLYLSIH